MKKKTAAAAAAPGDGPKHLAAAETTTFHSLMNLIEHCIVTRYDDGDARQPGWLQIKTVGSAWQVTCKDPDTCQQMVTHGQTLDEALALADLLLGTDSAPWETDTWAKARKGKNR